MRVPEALEGAPDSRIEKLPDDCLETETRLSAVCKSLVMRFGRFDDPQVNQITFVEGRLSHRTSSENES